MPRAGQGFVKYLPGLGLVLVFGLFGLSWRSSDSTPAFLQLPAVQWGLAATIAVIISVQSLLLLRKLFTNPVGRWKSAASCAAYFLMLFSMAVAYSTVDRIMSDIVSTQSPGRMTSLLPALLQKLNDPQITLERREKAASMIYRITGEAVRYETTGGQSAIFTPTAKDEAGRATHLDSEADTAQIFAVVKKNLARANELAVGFMQIFFLTFAIGVVVLAFRRPPTA